MSLWLQSSLRRATGPQGFTLPVLLPRRCLSSKVPPGMANAGSHQSPIVDELWRRRNPGCGRTQDLLPGAPRPLVRRPPSHSLTEIRYEFEDPGNAALVDKYTNPWGQLRVGRLLEDLDALAGTVAFKHCLPEDSCWAPQHLVTAAVDRIRCVHRPNLKDDILLTGQVIWVGRTSMVIQMLARASWAREPFVDARFTFVARDPQTGKASQINPLEVRSPEEQALFDSGEALNEERKRSRALARNSLMGQPIDAEVRRHSLCRARQNELHRILCAGPTIGGQLHLVGRVCYPPAYTFGLATSATGPYCSERAPRGSVAPAHHAHAGKQERYPVVRHTPAQRTDYSAPATEHGRPHLWRLSYASRIRAGICHSVSLL